MPSMALGTFLILCPTSFFLGILFSLFPYDYPLLWSTSAITPLHLDLVETHLKLLFHSPSLIQQIFHLVIGVGILGFIVKLFKPTESNLLFDGGSLLLYMIGLIIYIANTVKGLRIVDQGLYGIGLEKLDQDQADDVDAGGYDVETGNSVLGREDNLKVLAASNTILALVLVGVLVLQVGQWYAERTDERVAKEYAAKDKEQKKAKGEAGAEVKRQTSGREGKKTK